MIKKTTLISEHIPNSFGIYDNYHNIFYTAEGSELMNNFHEYSRTIARTYNISRTTKKKEIKDEKSQKIFKSTKNFETCHISFDFENVINNWDHDHLTWKYRTALYSECNFACTINYKNFFQF